MTNNVFPFTVTLEIPTDDQEAVLSRLERELGSYFPDLQAALREFINLNAAGWDECAASGTCQIHEGKAAFVREVEADFDLEEEDED